MESKELIWCEHLKYKLSKSSQKHRWFFVNGDIYGQPIADNWIICPICQQVKPAEEKRKLLWEIFANIDNDFNADRSYADSKRLAKAAIEAVIEVYERWRSNNRDYQIELSDYLKKELLGED